MRISKLIIDYGKYSDAVLSQKAITVKLALTGNQYFPSTLPTLADFTAIQQNFETALSKIGSGDRLLIAMKNQARLALVSAMRQLALDIEAQANGDRVKLLSCGLDLVSPTDASSNIVAPTNFKIADGINSGELIFSCNKVPGAVSYLFEYTDELPTEATKWTTLSNTSRELVIRNLPRNVRIYGRIKAVGRRGQEVASEILSRLVQ